MPDIRNVSVKDAKSFLEIYHYLGKKPFRQSFSYGLYEYDELVGVCIFHLVSAPETCVGAFGLKRTDQQGIYELGRLAMHTSLNGGNSTSWFVSRSIKKLRKDTNVRAIISYADSSAGHIGSIYRACNAFYCGMTSKKNDYYINGKIQERGKTKGLGGEWRPRPRKHRYVWLFDPSLHLKWKIESCNYNGIPKNILCSINQ